jgi:gliding motility-associated-like protein
LIGIVPGDQVTVTAVATYDNSNVGTGKTITVVYTLSGPDAFKYTAPANFVVTDGSITAKALTITDPDLTKTKVFDGTATAAVTAGTLIGVAAGDQVTVTAVATYDNSNVGTGKTITVVYTLGGPDAFKYTAPANFVVTDGSITSASLNLDAVTDDGQIEQMNQDVISGLYFVEKIIPEGETQVAVFATEESAVLELVEFGEKNDLDLFDIIIEPLGGRIDFSAEPDGIFIFSSRTLNSSLRRVRIVFKEESKAGFYQVMLTARDQFGNHTSVVISVEVIAEVIEVLPLEELVIIEWGSATAIPDKQRVLTSDGQIVLVKVDLDETPLNRFRRGEYSLTGELLLPRFLKNTLGLGADIRVRVLPKPAPEDMLLSNNIFEAPKTGFEVGVGLVTVVDRIDNIHELELLPGAYDNNYFKLVNGLLYWSSADPAPGRTSFSVLIRVRDRDGNVVDKLMEITRTRERVEEIEIYNTFTPNADGINDKWGVPQIRYYTGARIQVFERSGKRVFYTEDADIRWDGTFEGKEMPIGSYYWILEVKETGTIRRGILNLLRK